MYELKEKFSPMQPRERLELLGEEYLSDVELLAILLRTGRKKYSSLNLALELLQHFGTLDNFRKASISELKEISGIGQTKAIELRAMIELGKRIQTTTRKRYGQVLSSKEYGMSLAFEMQNFEQEHLTATYLDGQNQIIEKNFKELQFQIEVLTSIQQMFIGYNIEDSQKFAKLYQEYFKEKLPNQSDLDYQDAMNFEQTDENWMEENGYN